VLQELRRDRGVRRDQSDADADGDQTVVAVELERALEQLEQAAAEQLGLRGVLDAHLDDRELVAADAGDRVHLTHARAEPRRDLLEQQIARRMTKRIVDVLEAVQIQQQ
jgi:hypothetical protein